MFSFKELNNLSDINPNSSPFVALGCLLSEKPSFCSKIVGDASSFKMAGLGPDYIISLPALLSSFICKIGLVGSAWVF